MALNKQQFARYIKDFNFRELFNHLGWNNDKAVQPIIVDDETFTLRSVAVKSGFKILVCDPNRNGAIPDYNIRKKIETKITKLFQEHLIIFTDAKKQEQVWQLVIRQSSKPTKVTETRYSVQQDPELLFQRASGLIFELDEEENITIVDVTIRVASNFHQNTEKITKQFYEKFKKEHVSFYAFIKGIDDHIDEWNKKRKKDEPERENKAKQWYVSLMLNRLMFCYFIQKKGFLDKKKNYLRDKLKECRQKKGKDKFYSFYRNFLLVLFHEGLNEPEQNEKIKIEIGKIPYLNGGLFDEHELENSYKIDIDDKAFERIFDFFDEYEWHLDTRIHATGKDINPDVIGYIFEKYINDRAQMGAYYTKEDITDYISKNCIIPWLFDETTRQYPKAFASNGEIWQQLKESGDTYIYPASKHGVAEALPKEIVAGLKNVSKRGDWNKPASAQYGLPTEIWREVVDRKKRYEEVVEKIKSGGVTNVNDFITYNLNSRQFAQDIIQNTNDPEFLKAYYTALNSVTVIDPTCGSGAFLFAAMNILEPLYEACIQRMEVFVQEAAKGKFKYFEQTLRYINAPEHPNRAYFIYKSIILCNLYGVDIMKEAVEIAKLRLFLKLVATVEADYRKPNLGLEPLPDIDFNIRAGNTLIGFATEYELKKGLRYTLDGVAAAPIIEEKCDIVAKAFTRYKQIQLSYGDDFREFKKAKENLNKRLKELNKELNKLLHKQAEGIKYDQWLETHQPFHWFAEFYEIVHSRKGFDVIIGNPPYVEYSEKSFQYNVQETNFRTHKSKNLYSFIIERAFHLLDSDGLMGMIIPLSLTFSRDFRSLRKLLLDKKGYMHLSSYDNIPDRLFTGTKESDNTSKNNQQRITIFIIKPSNIYHKVYSTPLLRWRASERFRLFEELPASEITTLCTEEYFPKVCKFNGVDLFRKLIKNSRQLASITVPQSKYSLVSPKTASYYIAAYPVELERTQQQRIFFKDKNSMDLALVIINSNVFFWYWRIMGDSFHLTSGTILSFPLFTPTNDDYKKIAKQMVDAIDECSVYKLYRGDRIPNVNYNLRLDLMMKADEWILSQIGNKYKLNAEDLLWAKSNSFFKLKIPKVGSVPKGLDYIIESGLQEIEDE